MNTPWTEASDEVKKFCTEHPDASCEIIYTNDNVKRWTFTKADKTKVVFEQFFDINFFKHETTT